MNGNAGDIVMIGHGAGISVGDSVYFIRPDVRRYKASPKIEASSELPAGEWNSTYQYHLIVNSFMRQFVINLFSAYF